MNQIRIRNVSVKLPEIEDEELQTITSLGQAGDSITGFDLTAAVSPTCNMRNTQLSWGRIRRFNTERAAWNQVSMRTLDVEGCNFGSLKWSGGRVSRTRFEDCRLLGAHFENLVLEQVVFTDCNLDYAHFSGLRLSGPVIFHNCSLREAEFSGCNMAGSLFDGCNLSMSEFGSGNYRGMDVRGNNLSTVRGIQHLGNIILRSGQLIELGEALAAELKATFDET